MSSWRWLLFLWWCCCRPCAVVAVVRSLSLVVVCLSVPLTRRTSLANFGSERFVSGWQSTSLTQLLLLFRCSVGGFMMYCRSELNLVLHVAMRIFLHHRSCLWVHGSCSGCVRFCVVFLRVWSCVYFYWSSFYWSFCFVFCFVCLRLVLFVLRFSMSRPSDSSWSWFVIVLYWSCWFCGWCIVGHVFCELVVWFFQCCLVVVLELGVFGVW